MSRVSKDCARPTPNEKQSAIQGGGRPRGELAAPVRRVDISDRLGERPRMTGRIDACVPPLAVGKIFRIANDPSAVFAGAQKVRVNRLDPDQRRMSASERSVG